MLNDDLIAILFREAEREAPKEMCGLLFDGPLYVAVTNIAPDPTTGFLIDIEEYLALQELRGKAPWALVHSHPGTTANPSAKDCQLMDALYRSGHSLQMVIVGMNPRCIKSYRVEGEQYRCLWWHDGA